LTETQELVLPETWVETTLEELAWIEMGQSPSSENYNEVKDGLPFFQGKAEFGEVHPTVRKWCTKPTKIAEPGDILLSIRAPVGPTNIAPLRCCIGRGLAAIRAHEGVEQNYVFLFLRFLRPWLSEQGTGSTFSAISGDFVRKIRAPLPPRAGQTRIVEKLEELLSNLDAGVAELKAAQRKLAQYRQSLLKAAVEGALTADWRAARARSGEPQESGADLLQRILTERRARWEAKQLARYAEQGKTPPKGWQAKYPETVAPNTSDLPALPKNWAWTSLDALIEEGPQNGLYLPASLYGRGCPILRIDDFQSDWVRARDDLNLVDADIATRALYALQKNDLVINRVNSLTHLGKSLVVHDGLAGALFESNMMRVCLSDDVNAAYIGLYLRSPVGRERLISDAKWAVNQASINQQDVKRTLIPLPPLEEQAAIAASVQTGLDATRQQEAAVDHALKQAAAQRKNILKAAFAGQLVPQDPNDEPASALLERIRTDRNNGRTQRPAARRRRMPSTPETEA